MRKMNFQTDKVYSTMIATLFPVITMMLIASVIAVNSMGGLANRLIAARYDRIEPGDLWNETVVAHIKGERKAIADNPREAIVSRWAKISLPEMPLTWELKVYPPRQVLARLTAGYEVDRANQFLQAMNPWNASGSEWDVRELWGWRKSYDDNFRLGHRGDYDFTQSVLVTILYKFANQPELLYPETVDHIVSRLLVDRGGPRPHVPNSLRLVAETENHLLMTESARYLTNQWLFNRYDMREPEYDNKRNGLQEWLANLLEQILKGGFYEFNSIPYQGYALQPLMNLEAYAACDNIAGLSGKIIDAELWRYLFSSLEYKRSVPFRRQLRRAADPDLTQDRMTHIAAVWTTKCIDSLAESLRQRLLRSPFALDAATASYKPPAALVRLLAQTSDKEFFVLMGRGRGGSPEIYSSGPGYLISAGGAAPAGNRDIAVRPIVLLLKDGEYNRNRYFQIPVTRRDRQVMNRTGVYHRLACGNAPVQIPRDLQPLKEEGAWRIFRPLADSNLLVAVCNLENFGLFAVFPDYEETAAKLMQSILAVNPENQLLRRFTFPDTGEIIEYEIDAPADLWVIKPGEASVPRNFRAWKRINGWVQ